MDEFKALAASWLRSFLASALAVCTGSTAISRSAPPSVASGIPNQLERYFASKVDERRIKHKFVI